MNHLEETSNGNILTINSKEVAELIGKEHSHLMRDIRGYIEVLSKSHSPDLDSEKFFIESTYLNTRNQIQPCFLLTRKGCDMVANKLTGEKGILFTATYINKFEELEAIVNGSNSISVNDVNSIISKKVNEAIIDIDNKYSNYIRPLAVDKVRIAKYIKQRLGIKKADEDFYLVKERVLILLDAEKWEDVPAYKLKDAFKLIDESIDVMIKGRSLKQINWF